MRFIDLDWQHQFELAIRTPNIHIGSFLSLRRIPQLSPKREGVCPPVQTWTVPQVFQESNLTASQRAMAAARTKEIYEEQAKERQKESGKIHGRGKE